MNHLRHTMSMLWVLLLAKSSTCPWSLPCLNGRWGEKKRNCESFPTPKSLSLTLSLSLIKLENDSNSTRRMAAPPRQHSGGGRTTSLRGDTSESDKLDPTASWDALEWTKIEVPSQFLSNSRVSSHSLSLSSL